MRSSPSYMLRRREGSYESIRTSVLAEPNGGSASPEIERGGSRDEELIEGQKVVCSMVNGDSQTNFPRPPSPLAASRAQ
jgi:hypothetical protein